MSLENLLEINECIICFDPIDIDKEETNIFKDCVHINNYHKVCRNNWIKECVNKNIKPTCPVCRNEMIDINIEVINYKSFKFLILITSIFIISIFVNYNL